MVIEMRRRKFVSRHAILAAFVVLAMLVSVLSVAPVAKVADAQAEEFILRVGVQDEMKTRNMIRAAYFTTDVWTADVMGPIGEDTVQTHPDTQDLLPYVMVGTDVNGNGAFDAAEIGVFNATEGTNGEWWTAFYDFRGMRFHDGTQVEKEDILFTHHLEGLSPAIASSRFSKDQAGLPGTNYTASRWLWINPVPIANAGTTGWLGGPVADTDHQVAFKFRQTGPNAQFDRDTLQTGIEPAYFWQGTGLRKENGVVVERNIHPNFGWAVNPDTSNGVPVAGSGPLASDFPDWELTAGTTLSAFDINAASEWDAQDADVIGAGAFAFDTWQPGIIARIERNDDYFLPDPSVGQATLDAGLRVPALDAIVYRLFRNVQAGVFALQAGEIDFADWFVPPEFVGPLLADPNVGIITSADAGFFYVSYNFRRLPFGYQDPVQGSNLAGNDIGYPFRSATAHAIDKRTIVTTLLQNFGVPGHTVVSPTNTLYYNASAPRYEFDLTISKSILDAAAAHPVLGPLGYGTDPPGDCVASGAGCRTLPGVGTGLIEILTPQADYDPIRAAAGTLIAQNLRKVGLNVDSKPTAFGTIVELVFEQQDFDMWILGWSLTGFIVPSYIESFFHSRNTGLDGDNPEGYINATLDTIIDNAIAESDPDEAIRLWKWTQGIIASELAYDVLYFRTNIFAFRQDRIDPSSWRVDIGGDVYFFWSRILLDPAPPGLIRTSASAPSAVASGGSANVVVTVRDDQGNRLPGATVQVSVASGPGSVAPTSGTTDANGQFTTVFTAPTLAADDTAVTTFLDIRATHPELGAGLTISVVITTFPPGASFLNLLVDTPFGNVVDEGGTTVIDVSVTDETGLPAVGADVLLTPSPADLTLSPASYAVGTSGEQSVTVGAPAVDADTAYTVTISADRDGVEGQTQVTITVLDVPPAAAAGIPMEIVLIIVGVVGAGAAGGAYIGLRRRKK